MTEKQEGEALQHAPVRSLAPLLKRRNLKIAPLGLDVGAEIRKKQEKLANVRAVSEESDYFHGSRSGSLVSFHRSTEEAIRGCLLPMGVLLEHNAAVFTGERGNSLEDKAFNKKYLSVVAELNIDGAVDYATNTALASNDIIKPPDLRTFGSFVDKSTRLRKTAECKLDELGQADQEATRLITSNFPVVYGLKPKSGKNIEGVSLSIGDEVGIEGGCTSDEIKIIFVPDEEVPSVKKYLEQCGFWLPVKALSALPK
ncbi:hypothetical protein [Trinickia sp. EG282A]|uniref:hypothetical protein n=1 Tax=Trinickia sp. EG282A TaxID=3237013 RepID=UPI0034D1F1C1